MDLIRSYDSLVKTLLEKRIYALEAEILYS